MIKIYKSPDGPPWYPASPSPDNLILVPSSTPAGISTDRLFFLSTLPVPLQELQGFFITWPSPLQSGHVCCIVKKP